jgi:hypothetical protein
MQGLLLRAFQFFTSCPQTNDANYSSRFMHMSFDIHGDQCVIGCNLAPQGLPGGRWNVRKF